MISSLAEYIFAQFKYLGISNSIPDSIIKDFSFLLHYSIIWTNYFTMSAKYFGKKLFITINLFKNIDI